MNCRSCSAKPCLTLWIRVVCRAAVQRESQVHNSRNYLVLPQLPPPVCSSHGGARSSFQPSIYWTHVCCRFPLPAYRSTSCIRNTYTFHSICIQTTPCRHLTCTHSRLQDFNHLVAPPHSFNSCRHQNHRTRLGALFGKPFEV